MTTRTPTPHARALWQEVVDARRAEFTARRADSREHRRADDTRRWIAELERAVERTAVVCGLPREVAPGIIADRGVVVLDGRDIDPRAALVELLAAASAWVDAMDGRGAVE